MAKSTLNSHMEQKHQLKNFNQLLKRSFIVPNAQGSVQEPAYASENIVAKRKLPKSTRFKHLYNDPLSLGKLGDFSNNNANIKEEFNIIQEWTKCMVRIHSNKNCGSLQLPHCLIDYLKFSWEMSSSQNPTTNSEFPIIVLDF